MRVLLALVLSSVILTADATAQFATVGGGVLFSDRSPQPVGELHA
jgi:hypothetical protein